MKQEVFLRSVPDIPVNPEIEAAALAVRHAAAGPSYLDACLEGARAEVGGAPALSMAILAAGRDVVEMTTGIGARRASYKLNRELGVPRRHALLLSSPATGLAVASLVKVQK